MDVAAAGLAAYQRVAEAIKADIRGGVLARGERLPSNRSLSERHGVALGTAQKALRALQDEGWLVSTPAVGVFVNGEPAADAQPQTDAVTAIHEQLDELHTVVTDLAARLERLEGRSSSD